MSGNRKRGKEISRRRRTIRRGRAVTKIAPTDFVHATNIRKKGYRSRKGMERRERDAIDRSLARRKDDASSRQLAPLFLPIPLNELLPDSSIATSSSSPVIHSISFHLLVIRQYLLPLLVLITTNSQSYRPWWSISEIRAKKLLSGFSIASPFPYYSIFSLTRNSRVSFTLVLITTKSQSFRHVSFNFLTVSLARNSTVLLPLRLF